MRISHIQVAILFLAALSGCAPSIPEPAPAAPIAAAKLLPGQVTVTAGTGITKGSVDVTTTIFNSVDLGMARFDDPWGNKERLVDLGSYDQTTHFGGQNGSMTLVAETQNYPLTGGAYPVLTSFYVVSGSGTTEFVNLASACQTSGMWICSGGYCDPNPSCKPASGTASSFASRIDWDQHQVQPYGYASTNTFPRCDPGVNSWSNCSVSSGGGPLVSGHYYAKFLLLSDSGSSVANTKANLKVTLTIKKDYQARDSLSTNGGLNINVILVGDKNVNDTHTVKGARNLNLLFKEVDRLFASVSGSKLGINQVKVYEWTDANGGAQYSQVDYANLGVLFEKGSRGVDATDAGKNINVFLVSDVQYSGASFTILGLSGAILGPPVNGTQVSGLAFSSFDKLATYNPSCNADNCARTLLQNDFLEMSATITHELGHYLGLNHPSEKPDNAGVQDVDQLKDTPTCAGRLSASTYILDQRACFITDTTVQAAPLTGSCQSICNAATSPGNYLSATKSSATIDPWTSYSNTDMPTKFCAAVQECQFNHVMWYTTKNRRLALTATPTSTCTSVQALAGLCTWNEDGNLLSPQSSAILQWDPFVR
ncbi:MAG: hypothetical protein H7333_01540 [Bdellovibrionales bacterium]|nr:hypothetical protein [Oligoflexia bacterium]